MVLWYEEDFVGTWYESFVYALVCFSFYLLYFQDEVTVWMVLWGGDAGATGCGFFISFP